MNGHKTIHLVRQPMNLPPCMGGWCTLRETCGRYHEQSPRQPAERLCGKDALTAYQSLAAMPGRRITRFAA